jgi:DNA-binding PadR family transcriptional regulator
LWLLSERPLHGYRIRKILRAAELAFWFQIEDASIYSMLRTLEKEGFARGDAREQEGNRPHRTIYRITPSGRRELRKCLEAAWSSSGRGKDPICAALAARDEFEASEIHEFLDARKQALRKRRGQLRELEPGAPSGLLARREAALLGAEVAWIEKELTDSGPKN